MQEKIHYIITVVVFITIFFPLINALPINKVLVNQNYEALRSEIYICRYVLTSRRHSTLLFQKLVFLFHSFQGQ